MTVKIESRVTTWALYIPATLTNIETVFSTGPMIAFQRTNGEVIYINERVIAYFVTSSKGGE